MLCARNIQRISSLLSANRRFVNSASASLTVDTNESGVANLRMHKKPVNSLSEEFFVELRNALDEIESDRNVKGVVIRSDLPSIFSAGLDITAMYQPEESALRKFWRSHQDFWLTLNCMTKVTIAAISGHSPAAGCGMANACDYRIMTKGKYKIGLNETLLGITAPFWFSEQLEQVVGSRQRERLLQLGHLCSVEEALAIGLIDKAVEPEELETAVNDAMTHWTAIPTAARHLTKMTCRRSVIDKLKNNQEADIDNFVNYICTEPIQKGLGRYLEALKKKP